MFALCVLHLESNKTLQDDEVGVGFVFVLFLFQAKFSRAVVIIKPSFSQQRVLGVASNL